MVLVVGTNPVDAQVFSRKPTVTLVNGYAPGNIYDIYGRIFAQHFAKYLDSNSVVVNMVGGGTIVAANYVYSAPADGTVVGIFAESIGLNQLAKDPIVKFDVRKFTYIGRLDEMTTVLILDRSLDVQTPEDATKKEILVAGYGPGTPADIIPRLLNKKFGTKFVVVNYRSPLEALLAMEQGEVQGMSLAYWTLMQNRPQWVEENKIFIFLQALTTQRIPYVTALGDLSDDIDIQKVALTGHIGISIVAPPGMSPETTAKLRKAFKATLDDPNFIRDLETAHLTVNYLSGENLTRLVNALFSDK